MALARVQSSAVARAAASSSFAIPLATPPTLGNGLLVLVNMYRGGSGVVPASCTDNKGNTYTLAVAQGNFDSSCAIFYCPAVVATGASFTVTATSAYTGAYWVGLVVEVSGVGTGLVVDQTAGAGGTSSTPATGATAALTASEAFLAAIHGITTSQSSITVGSASPAWTQEFEELPNTHIPGEADTRIVSSAAGTTVSCSWTDSTSSQWSAVIVAFKAGVASGPTLVATASASPGGTGGTTAAIDTTGADLLVFSVGWYEGGGTLTISDSKGNTWLPCTKHGIGQYATHQFFYAKNALVGAGHTFTGTGSGSVFPTMVVHAFAGSDLAAPFGGESGTTAWGPSSVLSGSVTPTQNGSVVVAAYACLTNPGNSAETVTPAMTMTAVGTAPTGRSLTGVLIQTTAAAINPQWSWTGSAGVAVSTAVFKPASAAGTTEGRVTQDALELLSQPVAPAARITQHVVETLQPTVPIVAAARVTQDVVETLSRPNAPGRLTQLALELFETQPAPARSTQLAVEVFETQRAASRATQLVVEVFTPPIVTSRVTQLAVELFRADAAQLRDTQLLVELFIVLPPCVNGDFPIDIVTAGGSCPTPPPDAQLEE